MVEFDLTTIMIIAVLALVSVQTVQLIGLSNTVSSLTSGDVAALANTQASAGVGGC